MQADVLIRQLLASGDMNEETTAELSRMLAEHEAGTLHADDAAYVAALHERLTGQPQPEPLESSDAERLFGTIDPIDLPIRHRVWQHARAVRSAGGLDDRAAWIPTVLPLSLIRVGAVAIAALPKPRTRPSRKRSRGCSIPATRWPPTAR